MSDEGQQHREHVMDRLFPPRKDLTTVFFIASLAIVTLVICLVHSSYKVHHLEKQVVRLRELSNLDELHSKELGTQLIELESLDRKADGTRVCPKPYCTRASFAAWAEVTNLKDRTTDQVNSMLFTTAAINIENTEELAQCRAENKRLEHGTAMDGITLRRCDYWRKKTEENHK